MMPLKKLFSLILLSVFCSNIASADKYRCKSSSLCGDAQCGNFGLVIEMLEEKVTSIQSRGGQIGVRIIEFTTDQSQLSVSGKYADKLWFAQIDLSSLSEKSDQGTWFSPSGKQHSLSCKKINEGSIR